MTRWICLSVLLLLPLAGFAQSQAPVVWGEARWFGIGTAYSGQSLVAKGDTIVVAEQFIDSSQSTLRHYAAVTTSTDNGLTWVPWHDLDSSYFSEDMIVANVSLSGNDFYAFVHDFSGQRYRIFHSIDGGESWTQIHSRNDAHFGAGTAAGNDVVFIEAAQNGWQSVISTDRGNSWGEPQFIGAVQAYIGSNSVAVTRNHIVLFGNRVVNNRPVFFFSSSNRQGDNWLPFQTFPGQTTLGDMSAAALTADTSSETAMFTTVWYPFTGNNQDVYVQRTVDGGTTWEMPLLISDQAYGDEHPVGFCRGKLWGVAWRQASGEDRSRWGIYWRLSANHGRDWYPAQQVDSIYRNVFYTNGQFSDNSQMRLFWTGTPDIGLINDYRMVSGIITPDTLPPAITSIRLTPDSIHAEDTLHFAVTIIEDDTLSVATVVILDTFGTKTTIELVKVDSSNYQATFRVPFAGLFQYHFEAEDFWEHRVTSPEIGAFSFRASPAVSVTDPRTVTPSSFSVSVFPNPSNGWPSLQLSPDWITHGEAVVTIFNVLGQVVWTENVRSDIIPLAPNIQSGSGLFLLRVSDRERQIQRKILVLK